MTVTISEWLRITALLLSSNLWAQDYFQIAGYIQGRFTDREGTSDRLEIRRARVIVSGEPLPDLSYSIQADVAHVPYLLDASVTWKFSPSFRLTAGQFKIPFSGESLIADNLDIPIERARAVNSLVPGRDTGVQARDTGLQVSGTLHRIEYAGAVLSGQLIVNSPSTRYSALAGRALLHPFSGFRAGGDWYGSFSTSGAPPKRRIEAEANYEHGPVRLATEQIFARDGSLQRRGGYGVGSWRLSAYLEPLTRIDWITTNTHKSNTTSVAYMAGLNFYWGTHLRVGMNTGAQRDQGPKGFSSLFLAQTMFSF